MSRPDAPPSPPPPTPGPAWQSLPLDCSQLRGRCDPETFGFETTADIPPLDRVVGQDDAMEALRFGLEVNAPGQNIFVRGLTGTGRSTLLSRLLEKIRPDVRRTPDRAYVHDFETPDRPRLLTLPRGRGPEFRDRMEEFARFVREELKPGLTSEVVRAKAAEIERRSQRGVEAVGQPFDEELRQAGLALVQVQTGSATRPMIVPLMDGEPVSPEQLQAAHQAGKVSEEELAALGRKIEAFTERLQAVGEGIQALHAERREAMKGLLQAEARTLLEAATARVRADFPDEKARAFVEAAVRDVVEQRLPALDEGTSFTRLYRVNLVQAHAEGEGPPVVNEIAPSVASLVGTIDRTIVPDGEEPVPHMMVRGGALLRADGGYLILEARDVLAEPGAWRALIRTLRCGSVDISPPDFPVPWRAPSIKPEPIAVRVKVVLLGDAELYYMLDEYDPDFPHLFKVLADFDSVVDRTAESLGFYASLLSRIARDEGLLPFGRDAVALLCEHGARIAAQKDKLTARFGRLADIAREAAFLAARGGQGAVASDHVRDAVRRTRRRADLPARRFRELVAQGRIRVATRGTALGQVNGLAVIQAGPLTYGFPTRITATIGPGTAGAINIEREAQLSGAIHNKGFYILGGLLRHLLRTDHPLAFDASVAFEQSYGGIDGDSASGAEMCCLLSALTEIPLRQDLAMTGAIDQVGNVLPIGAVTEKIEGFFDTCHDAGLTDTQGVIVPERNVGDLMLREDVVEACREGHFHVYAVDGILQAVGILTGRPPGRRGPDGAYPEDSVLGRAVAQARRYWVMATQGGGSGRESGAPVAEDEEEEDAGETTP